MSLLDYPVSDLSDLADLNGLSELIDLNGRVDLDDHLKHLRKLKDL